MEQTFVSGINEENKILRECRGRRLAISRSVFMKQNSNRNNMHGYYVESESANSRFYYVEYKHKQTGNFCTCWDFASNRSDKCKHIFAVEYAVHLGLVQEIDHKLPISSKKSVTDQYKNLSIATLNELEKAEIEAESYRTKPTSWTDDEYNF